MSKSNYLDKGAYIILGITLIIQIAIAIDPLVIFQSWQVLNISLSGIIIVNLIPKIGLVLFFFALIRSKPYLALASLIPILAFPINFTIHWFF